MAPFFWRFQAREATGRPSQLPSCARSKAIQADRRRGRVFAAGSNSGLAELTFGPRVDAFGSSMTKAASKAHARSFPWSSMRSALARRAVGIF
jgi:hypothetical protein